MQDINFSANTILISCRQDINFPFITIYLFIYIEYSVSLDAFIKRPFMKDKIEFIAFDADDTLWESELYIQEFMSTNSVTF